MGANSRVLAGEVTRAAVRSTLAHGAVAAGSFAGFLLVIDLDGDETLARLAITAGMILSIAALLFSVGALIEIWVSFVRLREYLRADHWSREKAEASFPVLFGKAPFFARLFDERFLRR